MDPDTLVESARQGDAQAFRTLYQAQVERVHSLSLRLTLDPADAEELTQDVFVAAWRGLAGFRGTAEVTTWLHAIAVRLARSRWRARLRRLKREEIHVELYVNAVAAAMTEADLDLERALALLPRRMRTALVLHAIEGHSQAKVAEMMGISEGTVKAHVHRARALLSERLDRHG